MRASENDRHFSEWQNVVEWMASTAEIFVGGDEAITMIGHMMIPTWECAKPLPRCRPTHVALVAYAVAFSAGRPNYMHVDEYGRTKIEVDQYGRVVRIVKECDRPWEFHVHQYGA